TRSKRDWSSDVCSSDLKLLAGPHLAKRSKGNRRRIGGRDRRGRRATHANRKAIVERLDAQRNIAVRHAPVVGNADDERGDAVDRSEEHTSELQSRFEIV